MRGPFGKWYSIFNDGIQKFCEELNSVMVRTLDENYNVTNIPWALTEIPGGSMNSTKLCDQILTQLSLVLKISVTAEEEILKKLREVEAQTIHPLPPPIFKCCTLRILQFSREENLSFI